MQVIAAGLRLLCRLGLFAGDMFVGPGSYLTMARDLFGATMIRMFVPGWESNPRPFGFAF